MAGFGSPADIWRWPFHYFMAVRAEWIKIVTPPPAKKDEDEGVEIAPGITETRFTY